MKQEDIKRLVPIPHPTTNEQWRVPVLDKGDSYVVYIGKNHTRTFNHKNIPSFVISKLTMAKVTTEKYFKDDDYGWTDVYTNIDYFSNNVNDIGWRVSNSLYVVILKTSELRSLFGDNEDDTRSESKSEGKENIRWYKRLSFFTNDGGIWKKWCSRYNRLLQR